VDSFTLPDMTFLFSPTSLDTDAFAREGGHLGGTAPVTSFNRLMDELREHGDALGVDWASLPPVQWSARGEQRIPMGGEPQSWLFLEVTATVPQSCQRCLNRLDEKLIVDYWFRFVADEATADAQDDEMEEDLLVTSRQFDMLSLVEDELLMALPMVPLHDVCPVPVKMTVQDPDFVEASEAKVNPFATLAKLKSEG
jgi:uncharacterized protein